jgi:cobalt-precorrin 5A hydrolase/precorrin-3B C17-methyltransferase
MSTGNRVSALYVSEGGRQLAGRITELFPETETLRFSTEIVEKLWTESKSIIFIMAAGIAVRSIAPFVDDKARDPAVLVMDEKSRHVISLLGGHEAGANDLARQIAGHLVSDPVITTGTDMNELTSIDVYAKERGMVIENRSLLPKISSKHIREGRLNVFSDHKFEMPADYRGVDSSEDADVVISTKLLDTDALLLRPRSLVLGIGLNTGTTLEEIEETVSWFFREQGYSELSILKVATHEKKKAQEELRAFASNKCLPIYGYSREELNSVENIEPSEAPMKALGVKGVSEPATLLASQAESLLVKKVKKGNLTLALSEQCAGVIYVVGTGPAGPVQMIPDALNAIRDSDAVVGYKTYLDLIPGLLSGKEVLSSAMTEEVKRVKTAVDAALSGKKVSVISGGDPGIYAMAGLVFEVVKSSDAKLEVEVIPGISALNAASARLGAPLMHDFAVISLSDRLTPWELIEKRLEAAARADFVIVLYNPKSKGRKTQIVRAQEIVREYRAGETPVGIVQSAMREDEEIMVTDLDNMLDMEINMRCTVVIGNSRTFRWRGRMITPRGYGDKYEL